MLAKADRAERQWEVIEGSAGVMEERRPRWVNRLLWRVVCVNRRLFGWRQWGFISLSFCGDADAFWGKIRNCPGAPNSVHLVSPFHTSSPPSKLTRCK